MTETAFVTGASGFTGSRLVQRLSREGVQVRAALRASSKRDALQGAQYRPVLLDLARDPVQPEHLEGVDTVYHVAAVYRTQGVPDSYFYDVHLRGTERLLQAALQSGVRRFVHVSTVGVLGNIKNPPAGETAPYAPADVYQRSKLEGELLALDYFRNRGLKGTVIRPTAIYGPGDLRFLKLFRGIDRGVFRMIGKGEVHYHLTYIDDLLEGMVRAAHSEAALGEVFIIGSDQSVRIGELVELVARTLGRKAPRSSVPVAPVMLAARICEAVCRPLGINPPLYPRRLDFFIKNRSFDVSKARRLLGFQAQVDLPTGIACTAQWYREQGYL